MKTITIDDYVVSIGDNDKITVTYKDTDVTSDIIGKNSVIDAFVKSAAETIVKSVTRCRAEIKKRDEYNKELEHIISEVRKELEHAIDEVHKKA